jgi:photosystem II stability/assembly factor-like uncharacterized protein
MERDLRDTGRRFWSDDSALRPNRRGRDGGGRRRRSVLSSGLVAAGTAAFLVVVLIGGILIARSRSSTPTPARAPTASSIWSVHMLSALDGWALGPRLVARTSDGAATFENVTPALIGSNMNVDAITAVDLEHAWIIVNNATGPTVTRIYRTDDGGATWSALPYHEPADSSTVDLTFIDPDHGWAEVVVQVSNGAHTVELLRTVDGGNVWKLVYQTTEHLTFTGTDLPVGGCQFGVPTFVTPLFGVAPMNECPHGTPYIETTRDGGATWKLIALPEPAAPSGEALFTETYVPAFASTEVGSVFATVCVGPNNMDQCAEYGAVMHTGDAGSTWSKSPTVRMGTDAPLTSPGETWIANACIGLCPSWHGTPSLLLHIDDGAAQWTASPLALTLDLGGLHATHQFQFINAEDGFDQTSSEFNSPKFYRTENGGMTWTAFTPRLVGR